MDSSNPWTRRGSNRGGKLTVTTPATAASASTAGKDIASTANSNGNSTSNSNSAGAAAGAAPPASASNPRTSVWDTAPGRSSADSPRTPRRFETHSHSHSHGHGHGHGHAHPRGNPFNPLSSLPGNPASPSTPASSAFRLGSGAFASFGKPGAAPGAAPASAAAAAPGTGAGAGAATAAAAASAAAAATAKSSDTRQAQTTAPPSLSSSRDHTTVADASSSTTTINPTKNHHPLKATWIVWYRPPTSKYSDYEKSTVALASVSTVESFWAVYAHLKRPSQLPAISDYHIFRKDIRPVWEDDANKKGGKWIMRLKKGVADRYWEDLLLAIVGDQFGEAGEEICGAVLSVRTGEDVLSVWTRIDGGRNIKIRETIKRLLAFPADTNIQWKSHDDSIAQRAAVDQARHEKQQASGAADRHHHHGSHHHYGSGRASHDHTTSGTDRRNRGQQRDRERERERDRDRAGLDGNDRAERGLLARGQGQERSAQGQGQGQQ